MLLFCELVEVIYLHLLVSNRLLNSHIFEWSLGVWFFPLDANRAFEWHSYNSLGIKAYKKPVTEEKTDVFLQVFCGGQQRHVNVGVWCRALGQPHLLLPGWTQGRHRGLFLWEGQPGCEFIFAFTTLWFRLNGQVWLYITIEKKMSI